MSLKLAKFTESPEKTLIIIVILLISSYLEFLYGSIILGFFFLFILILVLISFSRGIAGAWNPFLVILGITIILLVLAYNYVTNGRWGNLDVMTMLFGFSLIFVSSPNKEISTISRFTAWLSALFVLSFGLLYSLPHLFGIPLPYYYGHYFVTLPVVLILKSFGLNLAASSMRIIEVNGVEPINLKIELSCFGWYSMLLALSTILSYNFTIKRIEKKKLMLIILIAAFASYLANLLRVMILVAVTYFYGIEKMLVIHPHVGWILFALILIPLMRFLIKP